MRRATARDLPVSEIVPLEEVIAVIRQFAEQGNAESRAILASLAAATGGPP